MSKFIKELQKANDEDNIKNRSIALLKENTAHPVIISAIRKALVKVRPDLVDWFEGIIILI